MYWLFVILSDLCHFLAIFFVMHFYFALSAAPFRKRCLLTLLSVLCLYTGSFLLPSGMAVLGYILCDVILVCGLHMGHSQRWLLFMAAGEMMVFTIEAIVDGIRLLIESLDPALGGSALLRLGQGAAIPAILILVWLGIRSRYNLALKNMSNSYLLVLIATLFISNQLASSIFYLTRDKLQYLIGSVCVLIQFVLIMEVMGSSEGYLQQKKESELRVQAMMDNYQSLEARDEETRAFRHDFKKHLNMMQNLLHEGRTLELSDYLDEIGGKVEAFSYVVGVNHSVADSVLNTFIRLTERKGIRMYIEGHFPGNNDIGAMEMVTILDNLLYNALEATENIEGGSITVRIHNNEREVFLQVENDCAPTLRVNGRIPPSSKPNKRDHGLGLRNVENCIRKRNGYMQIRAEGGRFLVRISMDYNMRGTEA